METNSHHCHWAGVLFEQQITDWGPEFNYATEKYDNIALTDPIMNSPICCQQPTQNTSSYYQRNVYITTIFLVFFCCHLRTKAKRVLLAEKQKLADIIYASFQIYLHTFASKLAIYFPRWLHLVFCHASHCWGLLNHLYEGLFKCLHLKVPF